MTSAFSNIFCCGKKKENETEFFTEDKKEESESFKIQNQNCSKSKNSNTNTNTKNNSNVDSNKKYSFVLSASSSRTDKLQNKNDNENENNNNENSNSNNNNNIIFTKEKINEEENSNNDNFSSSKNSSSERDNNNNIILNYNLFKNISKDNNKSISQISIDNSISSQSSSSIKNFTQIFSSDENSFTRKISKQSKSTYNKIQNKKKKKKEINIDFDNIVLDEEIELAPKLILSEINQSNIFNGKIIHIDASGCAEGFRQKRDGMTFFGLEKYEKDEIVNDIIINLEKKINLVKLFVIYYDRKKAHYYIQNLHSQIKENKFLMYVRIYSDYYLNSDDNNKYLLLGHNLISFNVDSDNNLNIKVFEDNKKEFHHNKYIEYKFNYLENPNISIGRDNCTITLKNSHLSRIHSTFFFNKFNNKWRICDGNGKGKFSTHGTWFILNGNKFELSSSLSNYVIKIGDQFFNIKIENE
jgi:hypothetical protein